MNASQWTGSGFPQALASSAPIQLDSPSRQRAGTPVCLFKLAGYAMDRTAALQSGQHTGQFLMPEALS